MKSSYYVDFSIHLLHLFCIYDLGNSPSSKLARPSSTEQRWHHVQSRAPQAQFGNYQLHPRLAQKPQRCGTQVKTNHPNFSQLVLD